MTPCGVGFSLAGAAKMPELVCGTSPADAPLLGQRVVLDGLSSRPDLNGLRGEARSFEGGRYAVALEGSGESVRVRPERLRQVAAAEQASSGVAAVSEAVVHAAERGEEEAVLPRCTLDSSTDTRTSAGSSSE